MRCVHTPVCTARLHCAAEQAATSPPPLNPLNEHAERRPLRPFSQPVQFTRLNTGEIMDHDDLRHWSKRAADWAHDYHATLRDRPVRAPLTPGATAAQIPPTPPEDAENMEEIFADFARIIPGGLTHWQHPRFFAYFPANASPASMLAEQLANAIAAQGMLWQTSPAVTELEQVMIRWLAQALGLPESFTGTIHDSATTATLSAVLTMREQALGWAGLQQGLSAHPRLRLYASAETHSSVDKAARIAGIGQENLVKIPTDAMLSMKPGALAGAIAADRAAQQVFLLYELLL